MKVIALLTAVLAFAGCDGSKLRGLSESYNTKARELADLGWTQGCVTDGGYAESRDDVLTRNPYTARGTPCVFPFQYGDQMINSCTSMGNRPNWAQWNGKFEIKDSMLSCRNNDCNEGECEWCETASVRWCGTRAGVDYKSDSPAARSWGYCNCFVFPTSSPTRAPSSSPTTSAPSAQPTAPTISTLSPTTTPTTLPTFSPSFQPTLLPSMVPTSMSPTKTPTPLPSTSPTSMPSKAAFWEGCYAAGNTGGLKETQKKVADVKCTFPFQYNGKWHDECISYADIKPQKKPDPNDGSVASGWAISKKEDDLHDGHRCETPGPPLLNNGLCTMRFWCATTENYGSSANKYKWGMCDCPWTATAAPTSPTTPPSKRPTAAPTLYPSSSPTTASPTSSPSTNPTTAAPTSSPTTAEPTTYAPSTSPTTGAPSLSPTTGMPTYRPTSSPTTTSPSSSPTTSSPTAFPSEVPSKSPTAYPSATPTTGHPTVARIIETGAPESDSDCKWNFDEGRCNDEIYCEFVTVFSVDDLDSRCQLKSSTKGEIDSGGGNIGGAVGSTGSPTPSPTKVSGDVDDSGTTGGAVNLETSEPTSSPASAAPTVIPSSSPSKTPSASPSSTPTTSPSEVPTFSPTTTSPTKAGETWQPSAAPSTSAPTSPTSSPSFSPTMTPSTEPTNSPSLSPTATPTVPATAVPTKSPVNPCAKESAPIQWRLRACEPQRIIECTSSTTTCKEKCADDSSTQQVKLQRGFDLFDKNNDGVWSKDELANFIPYVNFEDPVEYMNSLRENVPSIPSDVTRLTRDLYAPAQPLVQYGVIQSNRLVRGKLQWNNDTEFTTQNFFEFFDNDCNGELSPTEFKSIQVNFNAVSDEAWDDDPNELVDACAAKCSSGVDVCTFDCYLSATDTTPSPTLPPTLVTCRESSPGSGFSQVTFNYRTCERRRLKICKGDGASVSCVALCEADAASNYEKAAAAFGMFRDSTSSEGCSKMTTSGACKAIKGCSWRMTTLDENDGECDEAWSLNELSRYVETVVFAEGSEAINKWQKNRTQFELDYVKELRTAIGSPHTGKLTKFEYTHGTRPQKFSFQSLSENGMIFGTKKDEFNGKYSYSTLFQEIDSNCNGELSESEIQELINTFEKVKGTKVSKTASELLSTCRDACGGNVCDKACYQNSADANTGAIIGSFVGLAVFCCILGALILWCIFYAIYKRRPEYLPSPVKRRFDKIYFHPTTRKASEHMHKGLERMQVPKGLISGDKDRVTKLNLEATEEHHIMRRESKKSLSPRKKPLNKPALSSTFPLPDVAEVTTQPDEAYATTNPSEVELIENANQLELT